jgi:leucyl-tRNA synthetase
MKRYNPAEIEPKWQQVWQEDSRYQASMDSEKPKYYV